MAHFRCNIFIGFISLTFLIFLSTSKRSQDDVDWHSITIKFGKFEQLFEASLKPKSFDKKFGHEFEDADEVAFHINNINEYLRAVILDTRNCIIHITTYRGIVYLPSFHFPVILKRPLPALIKIRTVFSNKFMYDKERIGWVVTPNQFQQYNWTNLTQHECNISRFFNGANYHYLDLCNRIDIFEFAMQSKPWACQIQVSLLPPPYIFRKHTVNHLISTTYEESLVELYHTNMWKFNVEDMYLGFFGTLPSPIPRTNMLIIDASISDKYNLDEFVKHTYDSINRELSITHDVFLLFETGSTGEKNYIFDSSNSKNMSNTRVYVLKPCFHCSYKIFNNPNTVKMEISLASLKDEMSTNWSRLTFPTKSEKILWSVQEVNIAREQDLIHSVDWCESIDSTRLFSKLFQNITMSKKFAVVTRHIWEAIMANHTTLTDDRVNCEGVDSELASRNKLFSVEETLTRLKFMSRYTQHAYHLPAYVQDKFNALRFVACGRRGLYPFPFMQLFAIFDFYIWSFLGFTGLTVTTSLYFFRKKTKVSFSILIFCFIKSLLDQGSPYRHSLKESIKMKVLIALTLLMGIMLSNCYKNTNVYKMITPRRRMFYETIEDLLTDYFTVYSGGSVGYMDFKSDALLKFNLTQVDFSKHMILVGDYSAVITADVTLYEVINEVDTNVFQNTQLHLETILKFLRELLDNELINRLSPLPSNIANDIADTMLRDYEKIAFFKLLELCNKTAFVLPHLTVLEFARELKHLVTSLDIHVGQEMYFESYVVSLLKGLIPPFIIQRLKATRAAGIWEWLLKLLEHAGSGSNFEITNQRMTRLQENGKHRTSMSGNILVIFSVLLAGIVVSILSFVCEKTFALFIGRRP